MTAALIGDFPEAGPEVHRDLRRALGRTPAGRAVAGRLLFMRGRSWVRHDEHYHVDFRLAAT